MHPIEEKLPLVPERPGVYLMKGESGTVLYVGKAKNLKARLRYYTGSIPEDQTKTRLLVSKVRTFDYILTQTEREALLLENTLIKKHRPRYNISLSDDKSYLSVLLDRNHAFPRFVAVRRPGRSKPGQEIFGPYSSAHAARDALRQIHRLYPLRTCKDREFAGRKRPCLEAQIGRCSGACVGKVSPEVYGEMVDQAVLILQGKSRELVERQEAMMKQAAETMAFEEAARIRDRIRALRLTLERQGVVDGRSADSDVIGGTSDGDLAAVAVLQMRGGNLVDRKAYAFPRVVDSMAELLRSFLMQAYSDSGMQPPTEILLFEKPDDMEQLEDILSERRGMKCSLIVPKRGEKRRLIELALLNAESVIEERSAEDRRRRAAMAEIQRKLGMSESPDRMECFDMSSFQGNAAVGSRVVFSGGVPDKNEYRRYKIRVPAGSDDYAMMHEVLSRRFSEIGKGGELPDLLLVDGGKGHLNMASRVLGELGVQGVRIAAIAKGPDSAEGTEGQAADRVFVPGRANPVGFSRNSGGLRLLQQVRDEAHRFAVDYHRALRSRKQERSALDEIPGIGPARKKALFETLGTMDKIRSASVEDLCRVRGMNEKMARQIRRRLRRD